MRPDRFERTLADAINRDGRLTARTYAEENFTRSRHGIIATTPTGAHINLQIVARSADGDRYDTPEGQPVTDTPHPPIDSADPIRGGQIDLAALERYVAALAVTAAAAEVKSFALYQDRDQPGAVRYGATFAFHSGAAIFLYVLGAGRDDHKDFAPPATVNA